MERVLTTTLTSGDGDCIAALLEGGASVNMETARGTPLARPPTRTTFKPAFETRLGFFFFV